MIKLILLFLYFATGYFSGLKMLHIKNKSIWNQSDNDLLIWMGYILLGFIGVGLLRREYIRSKQKLDYSKEKV